MNSDWIKQLKVGDPVILHESGFGGGTVKGVVEKVHKQYLEINGYKINMNGGQWGGSGYNRASIQPWDAKHPRYLSTRKARFISAIKLKLDKCDLEFLELTHRIIIRHIEKLKSVKS